MTLYQYTLEMTAGDIIGNSADVHSGGVTVTGGAVNNVYLPGGKSMTVTGALTSGANIGVTLQNVGDVFTSGWAEYGGETEAASVFSSDEEANDDEELTLVIKNSVTVAFDSDGGSEVASQTIPVNRTAIQPKAPAKNGYVFLGWKLNGAPFDFSAPITENITLTASWVEGVSVSADFESNALPDGWTSEGDGNWSAGTGDDSSNTGAHSGSYNAKITHSSSGNETWLIMPAQDLSGKTVASLSFWYINRDWGGDTDYFGAYYRINSGDWTEIFSTADAHGSWTEWTGALPVGALAANVQIAFKMTDKYGYGVGLDDILLKVGGHSFEYRALDNVITATCQNDVCALGEDKSLTLTLDIQDALDSVPEPTLEGLDALRYPWGIFSITVGKRFCPECLPTLASIPQSGLSTARRRRQHSKLSPPRHGTQRPSRRR